MQKTFEDRLISLEAHAEFQQGNAIALQTVLIAALTTVNRDAASRAYFTTVLKAAAETSYVHAISTSWSDQTIAISRRGMATFVGADIAKDAGLL